MKLLLLSALVLGTALGAAAQNGPATTLTVNIAGLKNTKGVCRVWLFNKADGFPTNEAKALCCVEAPIKGSTSQYVFANLPAGTYAVGVAHDENRNKELDANFMGIPKEAYGASRGVRGGVSGAPKFAPASFPLPAGGATIAIVEQ